MRCPTVKASVLVEGVRAGAVFSGHRTTYGAPFADRGVDPVEADDQRRTYDRAG